MRCRSRSPRAGCGRAGRGRPAPRFSRLRPACRRDAPSSARAPNRNAMPTRGRPPTSPGDPSRVAGISNPTTAATDMTPGREAGQCRLELSARSPSSQTGIAPRPVASAVALAARTSSSIRDSYASARIGANLGSWVPERRPAPARGWRGRLRRLSCRRWGAGRSRAEQRARRPGARSRSYSPTITRSCGTASAWCLTPEPDIEVVAEASTARGRSALRARTQADAFSCST